MPVPGTDSVTGIYLLSCGLFLFSIQDVIIKSFSDDYSILQIVFTRSVTAMTMIFAVMLVTVKPPAFRIHKPWPILLKGSCGFLSYLCYYMALTGLPLADAATITFTAPIMVTAMSVLLFRERVGWRRWVAVLVGFFAITLVVGPKGHINNAAVLLALGAAFAYAISTIVTRYIDSRDTAATAALYSMLSFLFWSIVCSLVVFIFWHEEVAGVGPQAFLLRDWKTPGQVDQWLLVLLGMITTVGFYCLVKAYMVSEFSAVAPFEYLYILWGTMFGFLLWREIPSLATMAGIGLLVASNLYILRREMALRARNAFRRPRIPHR